MGSPYGYGQTDDRKYNARIAERHSFHILVESMHRVADTKPTDPIVMRRRQYVEAAKQTWWNAVEAIDR